MNFSLQNDELQRDGFCWLREALGPDEVDATNARLEEVLAEQADGVLTSREQAYGIRNLLQLWPEVVELVRQPEILEFLTQQLGPRFGAVRVLFFDKPPGRSWTLPWHRDRTIAVKNHTGWKAAGFRNPTKKAGIPHLVAPSELLAEMVTLRFLLDPMTEENGPLVVIPGSHQIASASDDDLANAEDRMQVTLGEAGDVFVMRPLLAHSSLKSDEQTELRRRVLHVELSARETLPGGLKWKEFARLTP
ncbi:MAG: phytanoyl-CoA dioxygenase family protein [Planctomycetota bacterium]